MQQALQGQSSTVDTTAARAGLPGSAQLNAFVINLCSSTSPVALTQPDHAGLKRFTFFVSRRREESRERFRLHMGYFETQEEAEKLLDVVREIYPGAWAGLAPGQRLRAAAAQYAAAAARTADIEERQLALQPERAAVAEPALTESAAEPMPAPVPTPAAPAAAIATPVSKPAPAAKAIAAEPAVQPDIAALALVPDEGRRLPASQSRATEPVAAARSLNDVRAVIAALDDPAEQAAVWRPVPELKPAASVPTVKAAAAGRAARPAPAVPTVPAAPATAPAAAADAPAAPLSDAGALAILESAPRGEKQCFAVQLAWSVQPIDIAQVPPLAIFSAYTLYGAEGNREGRRWYGVRLGFFTDAVSAKQVAHYVRSEFATVSVVPVTSRERERARLAARRSPSGAAAVETPSIVLATPPKQQFEFIEDKSRTLPPGATPGATPGSDAARAARAAPGKRAKLRTQSGAVKASARVKPKTLEETLEILGAGELQVDDSRAPLINNTGAAPAKPKPVRNKASSRLGRLFERLSERRGS